MRDPDALPFVDEHALRVQASPDATWAALVAWTARFLKPAPKLFADLWKLEPDAGFAIAERDEGRRLVLAGEHRFARYQLVFEVEPIGGQAMLRARTLSAFPGVAGRVYRALVIGSGGHGVAVRRMLRQIARRATLPAQGRDSAP